MPICATSLMAMAWLSGMSRSWRMVGYPGLPATYANKALEYRGKKVVIEPQSIADFS